MDTLPQNVDDDITDFTTDVTPVKFRLNGDVYEAPPELPGLMSMTFIKHKDTIQSDDPDVKIEAFKSIFRLLLLPDSAEMFIKNMSEGAEKPIGLTKANDIMKWLMEKMGMRPTEPSPSSSDGSPEAGDGTSSTVAAEVAALT